MFGKQEVFIYNESYPLPTKMYRKTKREKEKCEGDTGCELKIKHELESFIVSHAKKVGTKVEMMDEESNFFDTPTTNINFANLNYFALFAILAIVILAFYAMAKKKVGLGVVAIIAGAILFFKPDILGKTG